jgi:PAS domain S-box-containing protein
MEKEIAEYRQKEKVMKEREEKYTMILESIEDGYFEVDLTGNLTFCNDSLVKIAGYSREELVGMNNREYTSPEMAKKMYQVFSRVYQTGKPVKFMDYEVIKRDGSTIFLEMSTSLMRDSSGEPIGFRGILRDITERKEAEKALQDSEEKYRTILENIEDGYYEVDMNGNLSFFNDSLCKIYGRARDELMGKNLRAFTSSESAKAGYEVFNRVNTTGKRAKGIDWEILRKDGTKRYVEPSVSPIIDSEGQQVGFRGILRDITERKQMDEKIRKLLASFGEVWSR